MGPSFVRPHFSGALHVMGKVLRNKQYGLSTWCYLHAAWAAYRSTSIVTCIYRVVRNIRRIQSLRFSRMTGKTGKLNPQNEEQ